MSNDTDYFGNFYGQVQSIKALSSIEILLKVWLRVTFKNISGFKPRSKQWKVFSLSEWNVSKENLS
ncbi:MAG: hypothetical protein IM535_08985 [Pseudanabaena sp. M38BS1SP1A06MG]|jgi:hypothetical protein|nr:hypothetical protein [Pseudanabaena sp. M38BS1SP1A06MG]MCA6597191.1 hypothetical protein [Pseudanabaena sp. M046S1SP1A06QC]